MADIGYVRVSTHQQSLDQQLDALHAIGVEKVFEDKMSGAREDRPGLLSLMEYARPGDRVTVVALDRLGRSLSGIIRTIDEMERAGVTLRSLREGVDFSTSTGKMLAGIFASLAEYERVLIRERAAAAREAARARGRHTGRPRVLSNDRAALARRMREAGEHVSTIATTLGVSRASIYRYTQPTTDVA